MSKPLVKLGLSCLVWLLIIVFFNIGNHPENVFNLFYQFTWYPFISKFLRFISQWFPFSVGDLFYAVVIVVLSGWVFGCIAHLFRKKFQKSIIYGLKICNLLLIIYALFLIFWAGNYQRVSFARQIHLKNDSLSAAKLNALTLFFIQKTNEAYPEWKIEYPKYKLDSSIQLAFSLFQKEKLTAYPIQSFKTSLFSVAMSKLGVMGYYQPFYGEGTLNKNIPKVDMPFIICHEMAHQKGIAYEDEAHLMAVWLIKNHGNPVFKFSMYINMLDYLLPVNKSYDQKIYAENIQKLHPEIFKILKQRQDYWKTQTGFLQNTSSFMFDKLLKANDQEKGIQSYLGINQWLYGLYMNEFQP